MFQIQSFFYLIFDNVKGILGSTKKKQKMKFWSNPWVFLEDFKLEIKDLLNGVEKEVEEKLTNAGYKVNK